AAAVAGEKIVLSLITVLTDLHTQIDELEADIREALLAHPDGAVFTSLPRAGTIRAATLLAEIGDCRARFPDDAALAAAAGVPPSPPPIGQAPQRRLPARLQQTTTSRAHRLGPGHPTGQPVGRNDLPLRPSPRRSTPPRRTHSRPRLDPRPLALLARPHP